MKFAIKKTGLINKLNVLSKVIDRKPAMHVLSYVKLDIVDSKLVLTGINQSKATYSILAVDIDNQEASAACVVPFDKFYDIIKACDEQIDIHVNDNKLKVSTKSAKYKLLCGDISEYPEADPEGEYSDQYSYTAGELLEMVDTVSYALARNEPNSLTSNIKFSQNGIATTDGSRLCIYGNVISTDGFKLHISNLPELLSLLKGVEPCVVVNARFDDTEVVFAGDGFKLKLPLPYGAYPNVSQFVDKEFIASLSVDKNTLASGLNKVKMLANELSRVVKIEVKDDLLYISSHSPEIGEASVEVELIDCKINNFSFAVNVEYMLDMLNNHNTEVVKLMLQKIPQPILSKDGGYVHLLMPIQLRTD